MSTANALALARATEAHWAAERKAAWDKDPGNINLVHVFFNAHGYHAVFKMWAQARDQVRALEAQLAREEAA